MTDEQRESARALLAEAGIVAEHVDYLVADGHGTRMASVCLEALMRHASRAIDGADGTDVARELTLARRLRDVVLAALDEEGAEVVEEQGAVWAAWRTGDRTADDEQAALRARERDVRARAEALRYLAHDARWLRWS